MYNALANDLSIDTSDEAQLLSYFSGNAVPENASAIATAYAGHQFGNFVPQLGDGRAILIGELIDEAGKLNDILWARPRSPPRPSLFPTDVSS